MVKTGNLFTKRQRGDHMIKRAHLLAQTAGLVLGLSVLGSSHLSAAELLMIEEEGCYWCDAWNEDVAPIYSKTLEGKAVPLSRAGIDDVDTLVTVKSLVLFTPTFILVEDGKEVDRIEGYPGADFFWGTLGKMLEKLSPDGGPVLNTSG